MPTKPPPEPPAPVKIQPPAAFSFLTITYALRLLQFRWRVTATVMALTLGMVAWALSRPYSALAVIKVEGLGPDGVVTNSTEPNRWGVYQSVDY